MNIKLFRNQGEAGGGGAPAQTSPNPQPSVAAPSAPAGGASNSGGETAFERFQGQLASLSMGDTKSSQPPKDGKQGDASASESQGEDGGKPADDQSTTVDDEGGSTDIEEKGAQENQWSEDELKGLKDHGLDDMPFHPSARKLMQSNRELRTKFDQVSASNANAITEAETIRQAIYAAAAGDAKVLQDTLGIDLKLNQRTHDDQLKEFGEYHGSQLQVLQEAINRFEGAGQMEIAQALLDVGNKVLGFWDTKAKTVQTEKEWQDRETKLLQKVGKASDPQAKYKELSQAAQTNLAKLTAEDPEAAKYYAAVEEATKPGGALRALGIDLAKAFGTNLQLARHFIEYGKAIHVLKNQTQIINTERKRWEADAERRKTQSGTRGSSTGGSAGGRAAPNSSVTALASQMRAFMGQP